LNVGAEVSMAAGDVALQAESLGAQATAESGLIDLCLRGDANAFSRLVALHESMVFNLSARLLGDKEEARDLSQDVFLQVYRTLGRFQGRSTLKTWIYRITVNLCRNRHRLWRRRRLDRCCRLDDLTPADEARLGASQQDGETPFEQVRRRERAQKVQAALLRVSFDHRAILVLREIEGLSCDEIAAALALPVGTVKSRLARGRDALRQLLVAGRGEAEAL
jgi:RNA polymerase sigma-70 factor (ECF subfamily)